MDPWMILPAERARHDEQFRSLGPNPTTGMVTGNQARGFMMQSGLPPMVLAQIWGLADMNGDGQMDINEYSIACKLITNKLQGFEIPKTLPPSILMNPMAGAPQMQPGMMGAGGMPGGMMAPGAAPGMHMMMPGSIPSAPIPVSMAQGGMQPGMMHGMGGMGMPGAQVGPYGQAVGMPGGLPLQPAVSVAPGAGQPLVNQEWAVPQPTRAKYQATFYQTDRARTGFLAGNQARHLLLQSGLPQNILAQIWGLADVDSDGRLSTEEFILAGHLCDMALKGEPLPPVGQLPPALVPPTLRNKAGAGAAGTPAGSVHSGVDINSPVSNFTFEDKRKENFDKGQAELQRRRQSLIDQQKREEEEKKKKEKEEAEAKEKQKQEMERQRLAEWEKQRKAELVQHRQREQEKVLELKAKKENLDADFEKMRDKVQTLTNDISETRTGVTDVKCFIDGMRTSRDTKMKDMADIKAKLKDQNQRLLQVTQDKAKLDAKNRARQSEVDKGNEDELTEFDIKKQEKEKRVEELRAQLSELKAKEDEKRAKFTEEKEALEEHKKKLVEVIDACKLLYDNFDEKRREVKAEKAKRIRELTDPDHAWDTHEEEPAPAPSTNAIAAIDKDDKDHIEYRAIYDFESSNPDELPFKSGDIIIVHPGQPHEPGWLGGELNGNVGWFPEAYVELADAASGAAVNTLQPIAEESAASSLTSTVAEKGESKVGESEVSSADALLCVALFQYVSDEPGDLSFEAGETIEVIKKEEDWWTGKIGDRTGVFPFNYVEAISSEENVISNVEEDIPVTPINTFQEEDTKIETNFDNNDEVAGMMASNEEEEKAAIESSIPKGISDTMNPVKPITPVTFPESGTESENGTKPQTDDAAKKKEVNFEQKSIDKETPQNDATPDDGVKPEATETAAITRKESLHRADSNVAASKTEPGAGQTGTAKRKKKKKDESEGKAGTKKPEIATVVAPYTATSKEQLSLQRGQMILVRKKTSTGWWQGEIQGGKGKKRQLGWFPASYVKMMDSVGEKTDVPVESTTATSETEKPVEAKPAVSDSGADDGQKFKAMFSYGGQNDDELCFETGDIITLISKDEEAWWKGATADGRTGVFPSNYVELIE